MLCWSIYVISLYALTWAKVAELDEGEVGAEHEDVVQLHVQVTEVLQQHANNILNRQWLKICFISLSVFSTENFTTRNTVQKTGKVDFFLKTFDKVAASLDVIFIFVFRS